jgi:hypothetical protein
LLPTTRLDFELVVVPDFPPRNFFHPPRFDELLRLLPLLAPCDPPRNCPVRPLLARDLNPFPAPR